MLQACASKFLVCCRRAGSFLQETVQQPHSTSLKGSLDCFVQVEAQFGLLRALQGRRIECRMQYEDITIVSCVLKAISVLWLVSLMTMKKSNSECCDPPRGWKPSSVTDYRGIYLEIYLEKVHPLLRVEMTCVCNSGAVLGLQKSSSRMTVWDKSWKICVLQNPLHIQTFVQLDPPTRPKRGSSNANAVAEVGDEEDNYPCQFRTNRFGFSNFTRSFQRLWNSGTCFWSRTPFGMRWGLVHLMVY